MRHIGLMGLIVITAVAYSNIFANNLAVDDHVFIEKWDMIREPRNIPALWRGAAPPDHQGVYRPVRNMLYMIYYWLWGANPVGYHLHSLVVHLAATVLVYLIIFNFQFSIFNKFSMSKSSNLLPFLTALLFGLHPVHTESITYIAASMEMTGVVFMLAAFWLYLKKIPRLSLGMAILGLLTYEVTLVLPLLLLWYEATLGQRQWRKTWPYWATAAVYLLIRFGVLGIGSRGTYLAGNFYLTMLTMTKAMLKYIWLTAWPVQLANNHSIFAGMEAFVYRGYRTAAIAGQSILDPEILLAIGVIGGIGVIGWKMRKTYPLVAFSIGWWFISLLPAAEIIPQGSVLNEKLVYLPSVGWALLIAYGLGRLGKIGVIGVIVISLFYGGRTYARNRDWRDDVTLWQKDVVVYPTENAYGYFALGNAYYDRKQYQSAIDQYAESVAINPGFAVGWASLGRTYTAMGDAAAATLYYQKALTIDPLIYSF